MRENCEKAAASLRVALLSKFRCLPMRETLPEPPPKKKNSEMWRGMEERSLGGLAGVREGEKGGGASAVSMTFGNESLLKCTWYLCAGKH